MSDMEYIQISAEYLRRNLPEIQGRAGLLGERFEVTNHGRAVFRIEPPASHAASQETDADGERLARDS